MNKTKEFINKAKALHGDKYSYEDVEYVLSKYKVKIKCSRHGEFLQTPNKHLSGKGCPMCSKERVVDFNSYSTDQFIERSKKVHGDLYDYSKVVYTNARTIITLVCKLHGDFKVIPDNHTNKSSGCPKCHHVNIGNMCRKDEKVFLLQAAAAHAGKYDYSKVEYIHSRSIVSIICPIHGVFKQVPHSHLRGRGCPSCAVTGYKSNKKGNLYVLECGDLTKVGITNLHPEVRIRSISRSFGKEFKIIKVFEFTDGCIPLQIETMLLRELKAEYKQPIDKFDGSTECFYDVNQAALLNRITELITQFAAEGNTELAKAA